MKTLDNEGISYALIMSLIFIIVASIVLALFAPLVNGLIGFENDLASTGDVSVQTHQAFNWNVGAFILLPFIVILGLLYWVITRTTEQVKYGG
jgi:hypothetical protein